MKYSPILLAGIAMLSAFAWANAAESETLQQIKRDGKLRIGIDLTSEGLSFVQRGKYVGLEVGICDLICEELTKELGTDVKPEYVNQEWVQITQELRNMKYDVVLSGVIPSTLYAPSDVSYTDAYLETGPVICSQEIDGKLAKEVTEDVASLAGKKVVVVNDPAVRRVLRRAGVYVTEDEGKTDLEISFPKAATVEEMEKAGVKGDLIAVEAVIQLDSTADICAKVASGEVDAGIIDMGMIWWLSSGSERWGSKIYSYSKPVGPYIYSAVTRSEDKDLTELLNKVISRIKESPKYAEIVNEWHAGKTFNWNMKPQDFLN